MIERKKVVCLSATTPPCLSQREEFSWTTGWEWQFDALWLDLRVRGAPIFSPSAPNTHAHMKGLQGHLEEQLGLPHKQIQMWQAPTLTFWLIQLDNGSCQSPSRKIFSQGHSESGSDSHSPQERGSDTGDLALRCFQHTIEDQRAMCTRPIDC